MDSKPIVGAVRLATADDVEKIAEVEKECFSEPWSEQMIRSCLGENTDVYVLEAEGVLCGFSVLDRSLVTEAEIHNVAVAKAYRGNSLSKLLMDAMIGSAKEKGITRIMLEVRASNQAAISLYASYGFEKVGIRPGYYRQPTENAILMDLVLDNKSIADGE